MREAHSWSTVGKGRHIVAIYKAWQEDNRMQFLMQLCERGAAAGTVFPGART